MSRWITVGSTCAAISLCTGCLHTRTTQYPPFPDQSKRVEDPTKARIYLIRPENAMNSGVGFQFFGIDPAAVGPRVDPYQRFILVPPFGIHPLNPNANSRWRLMGEVGSGAYLCWEEMPHLLTLEKVAGRTNTVFKVDLTAGDVYYLRASIPGFFKPTPTLEPIDEEEGQVLLKKCKPPEDYRKRN